MKREEIDRIKKLRLRCEGLNERVGDGSKPFIVISGRIMKRGADGKLSRHNGLITVQQNGGELSSRAQKNQLDDGDSSVKPSTARKVSASPTSKNGDGGSLGAPKCQVIPPK